MARHEDLDGDHLMGDAELKAPGGLLTLDRLDDELRALLADHEVVEQAPAYEFPDDPDDDHNPLVLTRHLVIPMKAAPTGVTGVLLANGIGSPDLVVSLAAAAGLELAAACVSLHKESGGRGDLNQRNVWGHDGVDTGGCYAKGTLVTQANYGCVRASKVAGYNGVGPVQITWKGYWAAADKRGGAWRPEISTAVGFETLAQGIRSQGLRTGFRAYNGSGPQAEKYADDALARLAFFRKVLTGAAPAPAPAPAGRPNLRPGATGPLVGSLQHFFNTRFQAYRGTPIPILPNPIFGPQTASCVVEFQGRVGIPTGGPVEIGPKTWAALEREGFR